MTGSHDSEADETARKQAIEWYARLRLDALTPQERAACDAWRAASPENDRHFRALEALWAASDALPRERLQAILLRRAADPAPPAARRAMIWGLGAGCAALAAAAVIGWPRWRDRTPAFAMELATVKGERRTFSLPDGTVLTLNTGSRVSVRYFDDRRLATLAAGEALFSVAHDAARPFSVDAGPAEVRVLGTVFDVRRDDDRVWVGVESGTVSFSTGAWWDRQTVRLDAGHVAQARGGSMVSPGLANVADLTAWRSGRLIFRDTAMGTVVAELNRYLDRPLRLAEPRLASLRVGGTFSIDDPQSMIEALPAIAPVSLGREPDGSLLIYAR